jgi:hypothetical protein
MMRKVRVSFWPPVDYFYMWMGSKDGCWSEEHEQTLHTTVHHLY